MPLKKPVDFAYKRALLKPLATTRNSKGASGKPCLSPLPDLKKLEATPLIKTEKVTEVKLLITQVINETPNPILIKITLK